MSDGHDLAGFNNIEKMVIQHKPDLLLSCGDWGNNVPNIKHPTKLEKFGDAHLQLFFVPILNKVPMYTLYGNHDNLGVIEKLVNESNGHGTQFKHCLIPDIEPIYFNGLKIVGINGNYAWKKRVPWHKTFYDLEHFSELLDYPTKLKDQLKDVDIFMTHEQPTTIPETKKLGQPILTELSNKINPKIHLSGHVHHLVKFFNEHTVFVNLGMALRGEYALIDTELMKSDKLEESVQLEKLLPDVEYVTI